MKHRFFALFAAACLLLCGCGESVSEPPAATEPATPARTLLVVPFDEAGAQAFLLVRFSSGGDIAVRAYPRETVFSGQDTTLYTLFANGGAVGFQAVQTAFSKHGVPVDRLLSLCVFDADRGLYPLLSALSNNLLFTTPPAVLYTASSAREEGTAVALSSPELRRILALSPAEFPAADYTAFRGETACAVIRALAAAFTNDSSALFSSLVSAGRSTFVPADETTFSALFSPSPTVRLCPVSGNYVKSGTHLLFYPNHP